MSRTVSAAVDENRLWARHVEMAKIGATTRGGVHRLALTPEDAEARGLLLAWTRERGFACFIDDIGNMFIRRPGRDGNAAPVMSGSHIDSQPTGGRFDGIYGVLAAFEALEAMEEAGVATRRPVEAVVWSAEEGGARFDQGCIGSQVYTDPSKLEKMLARKGIDEVTFDEALAQVKATLPQLPHRALASPVAYFIEAHIEQGPELEATNTTIGIVTGIHGSRRFTIEVEGEYAHAGTTSRKRRKDALAAAAAMVVALGRLMEDPADVVRFTVGRLDVSPNSMAAVPGHVLFTIDLRHPDEDVLTRLGDQIEAICREHAGPCTVTVTETRRAPSKAFQGIVPDTILAAARRCGYRHMLIPSGAGHDARYLADRCPSGMVFVPCEKGISHSEAENATAPDLAAGARVLAEALVELANR